MFKINLKIFFDRNKMVFTVSTIKNMKLYIITYSTNSFNSFQKIISSKAHRNMFNIFYNKVIKN